MRDANPTRTGRARRLRQASTDAERRLWHRLRSRQIGGAKFARQDPIGPYVVDFVCREQRLIIEVDGSQHATDERDAVRDKWLSDRGYRVLRFWNNDVLANTDGVLEAILAALSEVTTPLKVTFTLLAVLATIVCVSVPVERRWPPAFCAS